MQHRFSLLISSLQRNAQLIWAAWFCFRLNQMSFARPWVMVGYNACTVLQLREMHRPNWGFQVPSLTICTAPPPPLLNAHRVKFLQVLFAFVNTSVKAISNKHILGLAITGWTTSDLWFISHHWEAHFQLALKWRNITRIGPISSISRLSFPGIYLVISVQMKEQNSQTHARQNIHPHI